MRTVIEVLSALAALHVVVAWFRLRRGRTGRSNVGDGLLVVHTVAGLLAAGGWGYFVFADGGVTAGILGLGCWWITSLVGLALMARWLPARGRHAADGAVHHWSVGPAFSTLAHLGLLLATLLFTYAYLTAAV